MPRICLDLPATKDPTVQIMDKQADSQVHTSMSASQRTLLAASLPFLPGGEIGEGRGVPWLATAPPFQSGVLVWNPCLGHPGSDMAC